MSGQYESKTPRFWENSFELSVGTSTWLTTRKNLSAASNKAFVHSPDDFNDSMKN